MMTLALSVAMIGGCSIYAKPANEKQNPASTCTATQCADATFCQSQQEGQFNGKKKRHPKGGKNHQLQGHRGGLKMALQGIELTQAQKDSVKAIAKRQHQVIAEGERKLHEEAMASAEVQMQKVLTPEQFVQFKANVEKMKSQKPQKVEGKKNIKGQKGKFSYKAPKAGKRANNQGDNK